MNILILILALSWHPTIDGERQMNEVSFCEVPYNLGVSCLPNEIIDLAAFQGDYTLYCGRASGTFDIRRITSPVPVYMEGGGLEYTIIPEPATILYFVFFFLNVVFSLDFYHNM